MDHPTPLLDPAVVDHPDPAKALPSERRTPQARCHPQDGSGRCREPREADPLSRVQQHLRDALATGEPAAERQESERSDPEQKNRDQKNRDQKTPGLPAAGRNNGSDGAARDRVPLSGSASAAWQPRLVILFSGHMMDQPGREPPRFPPAKLAAAAERIAAELDRFGVGPDDLALSQAAAGGDLLFLEACLARGVRCQVLLPFKEEEFIRRSVLPCGLGEQWRERYRAIRKILGQQDRIDGLRVMERSSPAAPEAPSPLAHHANPYERCNLWLLETALGWGAERLRCLTLWDGGGGDGPGGTAHMVKEVLRRTNQVRCIDPHTL